MSTRCPSRCSQAVRSRSLSSGCFSCTSSAIAHIKLLLKKLAEISQGRTRSPDRHRMARCVSQARRPDEPGDRQDGREGRRDGAEREEKSEPRRDPRAHAAEQRRALLRFRRCRRTRVAQARCGSPGPGPGQGPRLAAAAPPARPLRSPLPEPPAAAPALPMRPGRPVLPQKPAMPAPGGLPEPHGHAEPRAECRWWRL